MWRPDWGARKLGVEERELDAYDPLCGTVIATGTGDIDLTPRTAIGRAVLSRTDAPVSFRDLCSTPPTLRSFRVQSASLGQPRRSTRRYATGRLPSRARSGKFLHLYGAREALSLMTCTTSGVIIGQLDVIVVARHFDFVRIEECPTASNSSRRFALSDFGRGF